MSLETGQAGIDAVPNKTSVDIWREIQDEKREFRGVLRLLTVFIVLAALIGVGMFYYSWRTLQAQEARYTAKLREIEVRGEVARGEATRDIQSVLTRTLEIREELARATGAAAFADRAQLIAEAGATPADIEAALSLARGYAVGAGLDPSRALLMRTVEADRCTRADRLVPGACAFLKAVRLDWNESDNRNAGSGEASQRLGIDTPDELVANYEAIIAAEQAASLSALTPYAHSALAQLYFAYADTDQRGKDRDCDMAVDAAAKATDGRVDGLGHFLNAGECLRKKGDFRESNRIFRLARESYEAAQAADGFDAARYPVDVVRQVYHGVGTTQIAMIAAEGLVAGSDAAARRTALSEAEKDLRFAAGLREDRGEGDVGRVYTSENIGFIYVLTEDWPQALYHTKEVNDVVPLAWNLIVRRIAAGKVYDSLASGVPTEPSGGVDTAETAREIACEAERVLMAMKYEYFDEDEVLKLLPDVPEYRDLVAALVARPLQDYARRQHAAETREQVAEAAYPTNADDFAGTALCQDHDEPSLLPF